MDDIYEPVYDSAALEDHLLPEPVETFLLVALCWCLVACQLARTLRSKSAGCVGTPPPLVDAAAVDDLGGGFSGISAAGGVPSGRQREYA